MRGHSWKNKSGSCPLEVEWYELEDEDEVEPEKNIQLRLVNFAIEKTGNPNINVDEEFEFIEFDINFVSSGYYDPGRISGPPEDCYPPEEEDEREMTSVSVTTKTMKEAELDEELAWMIFDKYIDKVMEVDID